MFGIRSIRQPECLTGAAFYSDGVRHPKARATSEIRDVRQLQRFSNGPSCPATTAFDHNTSQFVLRDPLLKIPDPRHRHAP